MTAVSPVAAPQSPASSALVNAAENLSLQAMSLAESGGRLFLAPFASTPRRHDASLPAAFTLAPWHLLGGLNAISAATSLANNRSIALSIVLASPVVAQGGLDSAFVNAAENLVSQAVIFVGSGATALAAAFERTLSRHPAFLPDAFIFAP